MRRPAARIATVLGLACAGVMASGLVAYADSPNWSALPQNQYGSQGGDVIGTQTALAGYNLFECGVACEVDGVFGQNTRYEVEIYQDDYGLSSDGIVGPATWASFESSLGYVGAMHPSYQLNGNTDEFDTVPVSGACTWNSFINTEAYESNFPPTADYRMDATSITRQSYGSASCKLK